MPTTTIDRGILGAAEGRPDAAPDLPLVVECLLSARTGDAVFVVSPDGRIVHWDGQAETFTGFLAEETVGRSCHEVLRGECEGGGRLCARDCPVLALARAGRAVSSYDMRVEMKLTGKRWVNVSVLSVESDEGAYLVHLMRDAQKAHDALEMARDLVRRSSAGGAHEPRPGRDAPELTPRQAQVLALLAAGRTAREIGRELFLSQATVRNHIRALLLALGAHSQLEALAKAREVGLLAG